MKKILYLGGFCLPDKNAAAQRIIANAKLFRDLGFEVELIGLIDDTKSANEPFVYEGFKCTNLAYPSGLAWFDYLFDISRYKALFAEQKPTIVVAYNFPAFALKKLMQYGKNHSVKVIGDVTEWYEARGNLIFKTIKNADIHYRMEVFHPKMEGLIVISKYLEHYYMNLGVKTLLLPPLVDKQEKKWNIPLKPDECELRFMYAGTGSKKDRLDFIIDILERIRKETQRTISLKIMGTTAEKFCELYQRKVSDIPAFVVFLGRIAHQEVLANLRISHFQIFVRQNTLANRAGFPTKFVESISSGTLVLTNLSSDLKDYMSDGALGFTLDIESPEALYERLKKVFDTPMAQITELRSGIDTNMFDYRSFIEVSKNFIQQI